MQSKSWILWTRQMEAALLEVGKWIKLTVCSIQTYWFLSVLWQCMVCSQTPSSTDTFILGETVPKIITLASRLMTQCSVENVESVLRDAELIVKHLKIWILDQEVSLCIHSLWQCWQYSVSIYYPWSLPSMVMFPPWQTCLTRIHTRPSKGTSSM